VNNYENIAVECTVMFVLSCRDNIAQHEHCIPKVEEILEKNWTNIEIKL